MPGSGIVKPQLRRSTLTEDLEIPPEHTSRVPRSDGLHTRFFGGEPAGDMRGRVAATQAVRELMVGKDPPEKTVAEALDGLRDAGDVRRVHTDADNAHVRYSTMAVDGCVRRR